MKNKAKSGVPWFEFTPDDLQILKSAIALFSESFERNNKHSTSSKTKLASQSLSSLQAKVETLLDNHGKAVEFDFNEASVAAGSLNMYHLDTVLFSPSEATPVMLESCKRMIAYFTAMRSGPIVD